MRVRYAAILLALVASIAPAIHAAPAPTTIDEAWSAWEKGDQKLVEEKFQQAVRENPESSRPHFGLWMLYTLQHRYDQAWSSFKRAIELEPNRYPFLYAAWVSPALNATENRESDVTELREQLASRADSLGILKAMANEVLGRYHEGNNSMRDARRYYGAMNTIDQWTVIGPFDNVSGAGMLNTFPPEERYDPAGKYPGRNGVPTEWFPISVVRNDKWIDFRLYFASGDAAFYANTFVYSPRRQRVHLRIGTSGAYRTWLNDELVLSEDEEMNNDLDTWIAVTDLQEGWNRVMVKCGFAEIDECNFMLRITDERGEQLEGLKVSTDPQTYPSKPGATTSVLKNFAEEFFRARIAANPGHLENYLLLADCFLRNDKAVDAELILRDALKLAPRSALLLNSQLEAFVRGRKYDEVAKTLEKIYQVDRLVPNAMEYKFEEHIEAEDLDKAEEVLREMMTVLPEEEAMLQQLRLYSKKNLTEKVLELAERGYRKYPTNYAFVQYQALIAEHMRNDPEEAMRVWEDYLDRDYSASTVRQIADMYLEKGNLGGWRKLYDQLLANDPASPGWYYSMSQTYFQAQRYDLAKEMLLKTMAICPGSSRYWAQLGEIERIQNNKGAAIEAYRKALAFSPTDYDTREKLRELEGRPSPFSLIPSVNVDSLIRTAPDASAYPDEKGVILLDDARRVVYEGGASESSQEYVVKLFNKLAIDDWKEYWIGHNSFGEELIVEKAVLIKPDGTEIKADVAGGQVVFKSAEEGDIIRLKWRVKNHYSGRLATHFWDTYGFNGWYPVRDVRYALLTPKGFPFQYQTQNMPKEPTTTETADGTLFTWSQRDLPAIEHEKGMLPYADVSMALHISSIPDWKFLVDWYRDVARPKARATFEIKEKVAELFAGRANASEEEKIQAIYDYITENIRYSSVPFRQGSHIPQKARDVLVNRIGDCKDVATLCIAMLDEIGVRSHHVLINTRDEGVNEHVLPSIPFNHCIVGVERAGGVQYLDLTANNYPFGSVPDGDRDAFMLLIKPGTTGPIYLPSERLSGRTFAVAAKFELGADNTITGESDCLATGSIAAAVRSSFRGESRKDQEKMMQTAITRDFQNAKLLSLEMQNIETTSPTASYRYRFSVPNFMTNAGTFRMMKLPWVTSVSADPAIAYEKREHSYDLWPSADTLRETIEINLPAGMKPMELPKPVTLRSPVAEYTVTYKLNGTRLSAQRQFVYLRRMVTVADYPKYKDFYAKVLEEDTRQILFKTK